MIPAIDAIIYENQINITFFCKQYLYKKNIDSIVSRRVTSTINLKHELYEKHAHPETIIMPLVFQILTTYLNYDDNNNNSHICTDKSTYKATTDVTIF